MLRNLAGWSTTSKMPQVYIHHLGWASSKQLLQSFGIIEKEKEESEKEKHIIICPNCNEPNYRLENKNKFCFKCKMVLTIVGYNQVRNEDKQKIDKLENEVELLRDGMNKIFVLIQQNPLLVNINQ